MGEKIVLDTNVLVSSLGWSGKPRTLFRQVLDGTLTLIISQQQLQELRRVLTYPKLHFNEKEQQCFLDIISEVAVLVEVPGSLKVILDDPDDDIILESLVAGRALSLISSDRHLLKLKTYCGVQIMTVTAFLEALEK